MTEPHTTEGLWAVQLEKETRYMLGLMCSNCINACTINEDTAWYCMRLNKGVAEDYICEAFKKDRYANPSLD